MKKITSLFLLLLLMGCVGESEKANSPSNRIKIACIGNSITYGYGVDDRVHNAFPVQLQQLLGDDYEVRNYGVSGRTLLKNGDLPYWDTQEFKDALEYKADIVLIKLGTNDSKLQNRNKLNEFETDYKALVTEIRKSNEQARVVLMLPVPSFLKDSTKIWDPVLKKEIIPFTQKVAYDLDLESIDLYQLFIESPNLMPDGVHPSSIGATEIAKRLYEHIVTEKQSFDLIQDLGIKDFQNSNFYGYQQFDFEHGGLQLKVVTPKEALYDKPWIWRARFFGHEPQTDIALLERGYHLVYCDVSNLYGNKEAVDRWNRCYQLMVRGGLNPKPALEAMSRGGLIAYNWAEENPDKISCIYADAPVLDPESWPGGLGKGTGSPIDWKQLMAAYQLENAQQAQQSGVWPIHNTEFLAKSGIPMLHVCGTADTVVPYEENTALFANRISAAGGDISVITKEGIGHHPHSLENPKAIVDFVLEHTGHKINFAEIPAPGSEYRSAAGWQEGKGWWSQALQIDSLCKASNAIDLLLIGNSITQGWGGPRNYVTYKPGQDAAQSYFHDLKWIGAGISGDRTEHILWRLEKGNYAASKPKVVSLAIGVNNFPHNSSEEIVAGLVQTLNSAVGQFPDATILFFGPLPTGLDPSSDRRAKFRRIHKELSQMDFPKNVEYFNLEALLSNDKGFLNTELFSADGIHLLPEGYQVWAEFIKMQWNKINQNQKISE